MKSNRLNIAVANTGYRKELKNKGIILCIAIMAMLLFIPQSLAHVGITYPVESGTRIAVCNLCHTSGGGTPLNPYGADYLGAGENYALISELDSDGDGWTNQQELNNQTFPGNASDHPTAPLPPAPLEITITTPAATTYTEGSTILADYTCTGGIAPLTCEGNVSNGSQINVTGAGTKTFTVTANDSADNVTAKSVIYTIVPAGTTSPPEMLRIKITPKKTKLNVGESTQYTAQGYDATGAPVSAVIIFSITNDTGVGSITSDGNFTALKPGKAKIRATSGNVVGKAKAIVNKQKHWWNLFERTNKEDDEENDNEATIETEDSDSTDAETHGNGFRPQSDSHRVLTPTPTPPTINDYTPATQSQNINLAGWRSSIYGYQYGSPSCYWINTAQLVSNNFPGSTPAGVWVIGEISGAPGTASSTMLTFPKPSGTYPNIVFDDIDQNEAYLTAFDNAGTKVFLQVEPADADINTLIDLLLTQYSHHPSVIGVGVDVEWLNERSYPGWGRKATTSEITTWSNKVKSYNSNYQLFVKHWDETYLGTTPVPSVVYIDDSEENGNLNGMVSSFKQFADAFPDNEVGFQIGYPSDKPFWGTMSNPAQQIGNEITKTLGNRKVYIFWVDFSIKDQFPPATYNTCGAVSPPTIVELSPPAIVISETLGEKINTMVSEFHWGSRKSH